MRLTGAQDPSIDGCRRVLVALFVASRSEIANVRSLIGWELNTISTRAYLVLVCCG